MRFVTSTLCVLVVWSATAYAQTKKPPSLVDFEMMTWPEVKQAIEQGKTTALIYNGGTEQRGPQNVNGGPHADGACHGNFHCRKTGRRYRRAGDAILGE